MLREMKRRTHLPQERPESHKIPTSVLVACLLCRENSAEEQQPCVQVRLFGIYIFVSRDVKIATPYASIVPWCDPSAAVL